jgi:AcrR family transcriptional regulator
LNSSQSARKPRPPKDLRDQQRRDQIVEAARDCVVRHGFHGASMGEIAAAANMSVGQIYRYFPSKEAIVHAIVERIVEQREQFMVERAGRTHVAQEMAEHLVAGGLEEFRQDDLLMLEISAEATRNPAVREIVERADQRLCEQAVANFRREHPQLDPSEASARVELLVVLFEGTLLRRLTGRGMKHPNLRDLYRAVIEKLQSHPLDFHRS